MPIPRVPVTSEPWTRFVTRVEELIHATEELSAAAENYRQDNETLHTRVAELEDDLAAARTSLRHMIRTENLPPEN
jgi:phage regulator Rha-like protein